MDVLSFSQLSAHHTWYEMNVAIILKKKVSTKIL